MVAQITEAKGIITVADIQRLQYFDGLRAILAVIVIFEHLMTVFYPLSMINDFTPGLDATFFENFIMFGPLNLMYAGYMAVSVFFVLSGFLLAKSLVKVDNLVGIDAIWFVGRRYLRFAIPVLVMLLIAVSMVHLGWFYFHEYQSVYGHAGYPIYAKDSLPTFLSAIEGGLYRSIFLFEGQINPVLWTVSAEMLGSILVLGLLMIRQNKLPRTIRLFSYVVLFCSAMFVLWDNVLIGFLVGILCFEIVKMVKHKQQYHLAIFCFAILIMAFASFVSVKGGPSNPISLVKFDFHATLFNYVVFAWFAGALIIALTLSKRMQSFLSNPTLVIIGKYSFGIYLTHYLILTSIGLRVSDWFGGDTDIAFYASSFITFVLSIIAGGVFYHFIEKPVLRICKLINTGTRLRLIKSTDKAISTKLATR